MRNNIMNRQGTTATSAGERAASLVEYALLVALIAMVCFAATVFLGESTESKVTDTGSKVSEAGTN